jgi:prepilin-type N-terminal cleavage/methylation domain-containing protein
VSSISLIKIKEDKGVTLVELMIALMMSGILIAALYRTFIGQQKTYTVQEQVADMQQNARAAIGKMMRDIRMAGFGNVSYVLSLAGGVNGFTQVITPGTNTITIVGGFKQIRRDNGGPILVSSSSGNQLVLNYATDEFYPDKGAAQKFISIGGFDSNTVQSRSTATLTLNKPPNPTLPIPTGTPIFKIQAITYAIYVSDGKPTLGRDENTGGGLQPLAENIENVLFEYFDANGIPTNTPSDIRMVRVTVTARTDVLDPQMKGGDGYRRRQIASNIYLRNMGSL